MRRQLIPLGSENLDALDAPCRRCVFWELGIPVPARQGSVAAGERKRAWLEEVVRAWGPVGHLLTVDGAYVGYSLYAPAQYLEQVGSQASRPVSRDAVLLATISVQPGLTGQGFGKLLLHGMARDLTRRRIRAVEAFADRAWDGRACRVPAGFLESTGFQVLRQHPRFPLMRLDLRSTLTWKERGEAALERLLVPGEPLLRPAPGGARTDPQRLPP